MLIRYRLTNSIGCLIYATDLVPAPGGWTLAPGIQTLAQRLQNQVPPLGGAAGVLPVGPTIRFQAQRCLGFATAWLITPDTIITAGHTVFDNNAAPGHFEAEQVDTMRFVLGWQINAAGGAPPAVIPAANVIQLDRYVKAHRTQIATHIDR
jgi:hypothetical protein